MLFWIFLMRCSSRSIVSKEIQKYDRRKFYFFSEKKHFQIWYSRSSLKKKLQKKFTIFFSVYQNYKTKNFAISKISNKKFRKHQIRKKFAKILWKKSSQKYFCEKKIFHQKKFDNKNFYQKKIYRKNFRKKNFSKKKNSKNCLKIIWEIFFIFETIRLKLG